ncbi:MAG TPA: hypothetical protein VGK25_13840 [Ignavibacteria bacterium]|jgi:hypothetical protein
MMMRQIRKLLLAALVAGRLQVSFATEGKDKIDRVLWTNHKTLTFEDFKGNAAKDEKYNNLPDMDVLAKITKTILVQQKVRNSLAKFRVYATMYPENSWIRAEGDTASLKHEQGHYDICEIYARLLRKEMVNVGSMDEAKKMFYRITYQEQLEQNWFDADNSGTDEGISEFWAERIKTRLRELEAYKKPVVYVTLDE